MGIIELNRLTKYYGRTRGIEDASLDVKKGEIFGFIGPNGAGKSTTIRLLLNLIFPTRGSAKILGLDAVRDSKRIKARIGYVPAEAEFYDNMTGREFLRFCAALHGIKDADARINRLSEIFEFDSSRELSDLSAGNKRKASIIQGFLHEPELVILDEPTSGLDPLMQEKFFRLLRDENKKGTTIFLSSHVLSEVQALCKRVAIIKDGRMIKTEDIAALRRKQLRKVTLETGKKTAAGFKIPCASSIHRTGGRISFMYSGDTNVLVKKLAKMRTNRLTIEEPPLEEIFMHFYE